MALYVYNTLTGALVSWCPGDNDPVADDALLAANDLAVVRGLPALDETHAWNVSTKTVIVVAAPVRPNIVTTADWVMQFTPAEFAGIRASSDPAVQHFLFALTIAPTINLNSKMVVDGLGYLVLIGLLTSERAGTLQVWVESL